MARVLDDGLQSLALREPSDGRELFAHEQIVDLASSIRLIKLQPGHDGDPISCVVTQYSPQDRPPYTAISYTWGPEGDEKIILMDDKAFWVRHNLYTLLSHSRQPSQPTTLWVDALCIDQTNTHERSAVVKRMDQIYKDAEKVLVWLGEAANNSNLAMEYASSLPASKFLDEHYAFLRDGENSDERWWNKSYLFDDLEPSTENQVLVNALIDLILRPWFNRVWIQQEASPCRETLVVCGAKTVSWDHMYSVAWLLTPRETMLLPDYVKADYRDMEPKLLAALSIQGSRVRAEQLRSKASFNFVRPLRVLLVDCWGCLSTDPRDQIYALRAVAGDFRIDDWAPSPDYTAAWEDVYLDVAERSLRQNWLGFLSCAGRVHQLKNTLLPSWVPDWSRQSIHRFQIQAAWRAGAKRPMQCKFLSVPKSQRRRRPDESLLETGKVLPRRVFQVSVGLICIMQDSIAFLGDIVEGWMKSNLLPKVSNKLLQAEKECAEYTMLRGPAVYMNGETRESAYQTTLIAGTDHKDRLATEEFAKLYVEWLTWLEFGAKGNPTQYQEALESSEAFWETIFCVTKHGYLCLVPKMTVSTDTIAILKGHAMPVVLRPKDHGYFELIGDCYVHGMMDSQAFTNIDEYGLKYQPEAQSDFCERSDDLTAIKCQEVGIEDYSRVFPTLGVRWINLM